MAKKYYLKYQTVKVEVDDPRVGKCAVCGKSVKKKELRSTALHHYRYKYRPETVLANPELALENTIEVGYCHHPIADCLRLLYERKNEDIVTCLFVHPKWFTDKFKRLAREIVYRGGKNGKNAG